jgi:aspartate dehydrogenase
MRRPNPDRRRPTASAYPSQCPAQFLEHADYFVGSPTCFADAALESRMRAATQRRAGCGASARCGIWLPAGALWGALDIQKMAARGSLKGLTVTMKKHPASFKVLGEVAERLERAVSSGAKGDVVLYEGPVRALCALAPNNVNTMACAALAATNLGFDGTTARLIINDELEVRGTGGDGGGGGEGHAHRR